MGNLERNAQRKYRKYDEAALQQQATLMYLEGKLSLRMSSQKFNIPRRTLSRYLMESDDIDIVNCDSGSHSLDNFSSIQFKPLEEVDSVS